MSQKRITHKDIAERAGVNRTTVSLALQNHPFIAAKTRSRLQKIAQEMGYCPDPMLSALAAYRNGTREHGYRGTLAWIAVTTARYRWRKKSHCMRYLKGAQLKAESLGYKVKIFDLTEAGLKWDRAASILHAQGIQGVLLCPQPNPDTRIERFPWSDFSAVKYGYSITYPQVQAVAPAQFRAAQRATSELLSRGYKRVGFVGERAHDERTGHNCLGGFLSEFGFARWGSLVPPFWAEHGGEKQFVEWFEHEQPDALFGTLEYYYDVLKRRGYRAPRDFGFACPAVGGDGDFGVSGVMEADEQIGGSAVEMVVAMIQRSERGISKCPKCLLVEGEWVEGSTLRTVVESQKSARKPAVGPVI